MTMLRALAREVACPPVAAVVRVPSRRVAALNAPLAPVAGGLGREHEGRGGTSHVTRPDELAPGPGAFTAGRRGGSITSRAAYAAALGAPWATTRMSRLVPRTRSGGSCPRRSRTRSAGRPNACPPISTAEARVGRSPDGRGRSRRGVARCGAAGRAGAARAVCATAWRTWSQTAVCRAPDPSSRPRPRLRARRSRGRSRSRRAGGRPAPRRARAAGAGVRGRRAGEARAAEHANKHLARGRLDTEPAQAGVHLVPVAAAGTSGGRRGRRWRRYRCRRADTGQ
jgi:hypothetical protein